MILSLIPAASAAEGDTVLDDIKVPGLSVIRSKLRAWDEDKFIDKTNLKSSVNWEYSSNSISVEMQIPSGSYPQVGATLTFQNDSV